MEELYVWGEPWNSLTVPLEWPASVVHLCSSCRKTDEYVNIVGKTNAIRWGGSFFKRRKTAHLLFIFIISKDVFKYIEWHVIGVIKGEVQSQAVA